MKLSFFLLQLFLLCTSQNLYAQSSSNIMNEMLRYEQSSGRAKITAANAFMSGLYKAEFIDHIQRYDESTPTDTIRKHVYFAATEYAFYELQDYAKVLNYGRTALEIMKQCQDTAYEGACENLLSIGYFRQGNYAAAVEHAHNDLNIQRKRKDISAISSALNTIAGIYLASRQETKALEYINQALHYSQQIKDTNRIAIQKGMASEILLNLKRYNEAATAAHEAFVLDSLSRNIPKMGVRLSQIASPLIRLEKYEEAKSVILRAIPILAKYNIGISLAICRNQLGNIAIIQHRYKDAVESFKQSLAFFTKHHDMYNEANSRKGLYMALRDSNPKEALVHLERLVILKDSLNNKEIATALSEAHAKYNNEQLMIANRHHQKVKRLMVLAGIAITIVILILLTFLIHSVLQHQKEKKENEQLIKEVTSMDAGLGLSNEEELFIKRINEYIDVHMADTIEVDQIASHLSLSSKQLNKKMTSLLGCYSSTYIVRRRIDHAADLLLHSDHKISDIALACGFDNPSNFARTFKEVQGCSPSIFRKEHLIN